MYLIKIDFDVRERRIHFCYSEVTRNNKYLAHTNKSIIDKTSWVDMLDMTITYSSLVNNI